MAEVECFFDLSSPWTYFAVHGLLDLQKETGVSIDFRPHLVRNLTDYSYPAIGRVFGSRDHTTVIHAVDKITGQMQQRRQIYEQVTELTQQVRAGT